VVIRCGTPDCDWAFKMPDLSGWRIKKCYADFREHCIDRHHLHESDTGALMFFNLEEFTLTLLTDD
jgi:hypothetical protein